MNLQTTVIILPSVGVRRHRLFMTDRPGVIQLTLAPPPRVPGPSVTQEPDDSSQGIWGLVSMIFLAMMVAGCAAMARR